MKLRAVAVLAVLLLSGCSLPPPDGEPQVDPAAPEARLLQDAVDIRYSRAQYEHPAFAWVPKTRPEGLERMMMGSGSIDIFRIATNHQNVMFATTPEPTDLCRDLKANGVCLRDLDLTATATDEDRRHLTVYVTGADDHRPDVSDPQFKQFWTTGELVPLDQAAWFTDLLTRADQHIVR